MHWPSPARSSRGPGARRGAKPATRTRWQPCLALALDLPGS